MTADSSAPAVALPVRAAAAPAHKARPNYKLLGLLALGHLVIDTNQGSLPALLPYLKGALGLTYTATGVIVLMANISSSLIQPLFGFLADKTARRWVLPLSVLLSSLGIALSGVAPSYYVVPGLLVAGRLMAVRRGLSRPLPARAQGAALAPKTMVGGMSLLVLVISIRSWTQLGFTTYMPFYYLEVLKGDPRMVGTLLAVFLGAGAAGTRIAGPSSDRIGHRPYMVGVFFLAAPLAVAFLLVSGVWTFVLLAALGFVLVSTFTVSVVLGQAYMPRNLGMASGLIVGFAIGAGGVGATALGWVADHWGLSSALWVSALMPILGCAPSLMLPEPRT